MRRFNLECAQKLVNQRINEINESWAQDPNGQCYLIRYYEVFEDGFAIQPTYSETFYGIDDFIDIVKACGGSVYVAVHENVAGISCPTLYITN